MPLASATVDGIFAKLHVRYGAAWAAKWNGIPIELVKADWSDELGGLSIQRLTHGLLHLPEFPPTVQQFRLLCLSQHEPAPPALPPARGPIPARVAAELERLAKTQLDRPAKAWAHALKAREQAGERLTLGQKTMWRQALGLPITGAIASWEQTPEDFANGHPERAT